MAPKLKVGILGGSFNPITIGHISQANAILSNSNLNEIWLMPTYYPFYNKTLADPKHRIKMCELAIKNEKNIKLCTLECDNALTGGTYKTLNILTKMYPNFKFYFCVGMDTAQKILKWKHSDELIHTHPFIVIPRGGYPKPTGNEWFFKKPHQYLDIIPITVSSTDVRENIKLGQKKDINDEVYEYAKTYDLYTTNSNN